MRFRLLHQGLDTAPMLADLAAHPELWDTHKLRRTAPGSPHAEMQDIWIRALDVYQLGDPEAFLKPHYPRMYQAWHDLPSIKPVVRGLMVEFHGTHLGNILITRIPAGASIATHTDAGWAVEHFNRKFYIVLHGNARCVNTCEDEEVAMRTGEVWEFDNQLPHGVENHGATDRISLIVTLRGEE